VLGVLVGVASAAACLQTGCAAPTLPIPPPTALVSSPDAMGYVTVSGSADSTAYVFVLDENTEVGVIVHANAMGAYNARLPASVGDGITVWQEIANRPGEQTMLTVH